jgi:hypothetical protein
VRRSHTSVIDAAGAIYVIGGYDGSTYYKDVWATTDGGADRTRAGDRGGGGTALVLRCVLRGYYRGTLVVHKGYARVAEGFQGLL